MPDCYYGHDEPATYQITALTDEAAEWWRMPEGVRTIAVCDHDADNAYTLLIAGRRNYMLKALADA